jgi:hypothetical protein
MPFARWRLPTSAMSSIFRSICLPSMNSRA